MEYCLISLGILLFGVLPIYCIYELCKDYISEIEEIKN